MAKGKKTGGRKAGVPNKATIELKAYAGQYTAEAIDGLVKIGRDSESDQARVSAWNAVLDRAVGKAPQAVTGEDGGAIQTIAQVIHKYVTGEDADGR